MADERELLHAQQAYGTLCAALQDRQWHFEQKQEELLVHFGVNGEGLPVDYIIFVDADRQQVRVMVPLSLTVSEEKRVEFSLATNYVNYKMADGSFDYDMVEGRIFFRMTATIRDSAVEKELFHYMIDCSYAMVDQYASKFLALNKDVITLSDFFQQDQE